MKNGNKACAGMAVAAEAFSAACATRAGHSNFGISPL